MVKYDASLFSAFITLGPKSESFILWVWWIKKNKWNKNDIDIGQPKQATLPVGQCVGVCPPWPHRGAGSNSRWWGWIITGGQEDLGQAGPAPVTWHNAVQCSDHSLFIRLNHPTRHGVIRGIYIILWLIEYHNQNTHCCIQWALAIIILLERSHGC